MENQEFLSSANFDLLWSIFSDDGIEFSSPEEFSAYIEKFCQKDASGSLSLLELNKLFIQTVLQEKEKTTAKNKRNIPPPITSSEIRQERVSLFEKELKSKQDDFLNAYARPIPETPEFKDVVNSDEKMTNVEERMKQMIAERNYEAEQIQKSIHETNPQEIQNWIKSQSTSLKEEKEREKQKIMKKLRIEDDITEGIMKNNNNINIIQSAEKNALPTDFSERLDNLEKEVEYLKSIIHRGPTPALTKK